jgi:hypothetical protein
MIIFLYTFVIVFVALIVILGLGSLLTAGEEPVKPAEGKATAAMCTTRLLGEYEASDLPAEDDFVIEQDLVYTYESVNI